MKQEPARRVRKQGWGIDCSKGSDYVWNVVKEWPQSRAGRNSDGGLLVSVWLFKLVSDPPIKEQSCFVPGGHTTANVIQRPFARVFKSAQFFFPCLYYVPFGFHLAKNYRKNFRSHFGRSSFSTLKGELIWPVVNVIFYVNVEGCAHYIKNLQMIKSIGWVINIGLEGKLECALMLMV
jgi:hypothetical protein